MSKLERILTDKRRRILTYVTLDVHMVIYFSPSDPAGFPLRSRWTVTCQGCPGKAPPTAAAA